MRTGESQGFEKSGFLLSSFISGSLKTAFVSSILFTLFLCYIDEGYYNFKWMLSLANWVAFFLYVLILTAVQLLVALILFSIFRIMGIKASESFPKIIMVLIGLGLGLYLCFQIFSAN